MDIVILILCNDMPFVMFLKQHKELQIFVLMGTEFQILGSVEDNVGK